MTPPQTRREIPALTWTLVFSPVILLFVFLTLAAHVRLGLGHWPTPMLEDYNTAAYKSHERVFMWFALFTVYGAIPLWLVSLFLPLFRISLKTHLIQIAIYAIGWGLFALYAAIDPGRFTEWFLD